MTDYIIWLIGAGAGIIVSIIAYFLKDLHKDLKAMDGRVRWLENERIGARLNAIEAKQEVHSAMGERMARIEENINALSSKIDLLIDIEKKR